MVHNDFDEYYDNDMKDVTEENNEMRDIVEDKGSVPDNEKI